MCSRTRENNKNEVGPVIWDTLYLEPWKKQIDTNTVVNQNVYGYVRSSKSDIAWKCECCNAKCVYGVNVKQVCGGELSEEKPSRH